MTTTHLATAVTQPGLPRRNCRRGVGWLLLPCACTVLAPFGCGSDGTKEQTTHTAGTEAGGGGAPPANSGVPSTGGAKPAETPIAGASSGMHTGGAGLGGSGGSGGTSGGAGAAASGGAGAAASGGASTSGGASSGGSGGGAEGSQRSAGCGSTPMLTSGEHSIDVAGSMREYTLQLPDDYDPNEPYRLIFGWHWRGGQMADVVSGQIIGGPYYGQEERAEGTAIFVAPEGIDNGWANTGGRDIAFLRQMLELFFSDLCIDKARIFSTGFSYGGMMSDAIACEMSDVFRAIAPMSGALYSGCNRATEHPIAMWMAHGDNDTVVPLADGQAALDVVLEKNGCGTQTTPVGPDPCVAYEGCAEGYPVHYCEFSGGHSPASFGPDAIWDFFSQF